MKEDFARPASEMFDAAKTARIPDNVQAFAEESVAKTRETYRMINTLAKDGAKVLEDVVLTAQAGAKALGEKVMTNANTNVETAFDAARAIARARTLPEVARIQGRSDAAADRRRKRADEGTARPIGEHRGADAQNRERGGHQDLRRPEQGGQS